MKNQLDTIIAELKRLNQRLDACDFDKLPGNLDLLFNALQEIQTELGLRKRISLTAEQVDAYLEDRRSKRPSRTTGQVYAELKTDPGIGRRKNGNGNGEDDDE